MSSFTDIVLDKESNQHLYIQLYSQLKDLIIQDKIKHHTKLPPIRKMADLLSVNNVTVVNAYKLLEQEGYVYKKIGSGTFVQDISTKKLQNILMDESVELFGEENNHLATLNLASTAPTPDLFPINDFKTVLNEVLDRDKGNAFVYQESQGYHPLRESIRDYIKGYGIETNIENIQIISGAQQGIDILAKSLLDYGDVVFTESPTYTGAIAAFKSRSANIIQIPIEDDGIDIKSLEGKLRSLKPKFVYIMPVFQNPTGHSYSQEKKRKILDLVEKYDTFIVEDDYLSDLSFFDKSNSTLKAMDKNNRVIYIKSFSKIFMPGLRLGFMVIPNSIYNEVLSAKHTSDISTSGLMQRAFDLYLNKGKWQKHIKYMESIYKRRFNVWIDCLEKYIPREITWYTPNGGLNFWMSLPHGYSSNDLYKLCSKNNILIVPGSVFYADQRDSQFFRISMASVHSKDIDKSVKKFADIIRIFLKDSTRKQIPMDMYTPFL
ncbi:MAG: PLP-dependent aminotransferase family protein [Firmicutes bacterium]|nr:PLP-dependent aminotransferase family protein [Bacillota bacterium]